MPRFRLTLSIEYKMDEDSYPIEEKNHLVYEITRIEKEGIISYINEDIDIADSDHLTYKIKQLED